MHCSTKPTSAIRVDRLIYPEETKEIEVGDSTGHRAGRREERAYN